MMKAKCPQCGKLFVRRGSMVAHLNKGKCGGGVKAKRCGLKRMRLEESDECNEIDMEIGRVEVCSAVGEGERTEMVVGVNESCAEEVCGGRRVGSIGTEQLGLDKGQVSMLQLLKDIPHLSESDAAAISRCHNENLNVKFPVDMRHLKKKIGLGVDGVRRKEVVFELPDGLEMEQKEVKVSGIIV